MNTGLVVGIVGGVVGLLGGVIGTYFSIKNTSGPRERGFMIAVGAVRDCAASWDRVVQSASADDSCRRGNVERRRGAALT